MRNPLRTSLFTLAVVLSATTAFAQGARDVERISSLFKDLDPGSMYDYRTEGGLLTPNGKRATFIARPPSKDKPEDKQNLLVQLDRETNKLVTIFEGPASPDKDGPPMQVVDQTLDGKKIVLEVVSFDVIKKVFEKVKGPAGLQDGTTPPAVHVLFDTETNEGEVINHSSSTIFTIETPDSISPEGRYLLGRSTNSTTSTTGAQTLEDGFTIHDTKEKTKTAYKIADFFPDLKSVTGVYLDVSEEGKILASIRWRAAYSEDPLFVRGLFTIDPLKKIVSRLDYAAPMIAISCDDTSIAYVENHDVAATPNLDTIFFVRNHCIDNTRLLMQWKASDNSIRELRRSNAAFTSTIGETDLKDIAASQDGRFLAFQSIRSLLPEAPAQGYQSYVLDLQTTVLRGVSFKVAGVAGEKICNTHGVGLAGEVLFSCQGIGTKANAAPATRNEFGSFGRYLYLSRTDDCPTDPNKVQPGSFGCGTKETDTDADGIVENQGPSTTVGGGGGFGGGGETGVPVIKATMKTRKLICTATIDGEPAPGLPISGEVTQAKVAKALPTKPSNKRGQSAWTIRKTVKKGACLFGDVRVVAKKK